MSSAVVSYVVNGGPRAVAPATAKRVADAIRTLGYRPNLSARALRTGTTKTLGLVLPEINNPLYAAWAVALEVAAAERGYMVLLINSDGDPESDHRAITHLAERQIDGLLVTSSMARPDLAVPSLQGIPTVVLGVLEKGPGTVSIGVDAYAGAYEAVTHLIGHGHARIGLIIGGGSGGNPELRESGWLAASRDAGLPDGPIAREPWSRAGGYEGGMRLFSSVNYPSAVFVSSDMQALGLLRALHELGLRVPDDVAIVSFDGTEDTEYTSPSLTAVQQPVKAMAVEAVTAVLDLAASRQTEHPLHPPKLILRESCGCEH
ncbi:LacI family DNA-binding transcriptional regulator [Frondihabitans cladoniiphilus]|uniref:LacI family DNA-binding transcriptional regulator n=1 Tax=Frondihabitans cladoniiphilus TaxID=715785 RepID=A0ABP8WCH4_9MICO